MAEQQVQMTLPSLVEYTLSELFQANRIVVDLPPNGHGVELIVPRESLAQALRGLLQNALDATENRQTVQLTATFDAHWIRLTIRDEGSGMPPEVLARAGEPFFTTKEKGTGLGLAVVQQVVEGFGGRIDVSSEPGRGARFDIWLPRITGAAR